MAPARAADLNLERLVLEQEGRTLLVRIDDPPYNFMTGDLLRELDALTRAVDDDASIGAVIVTGAPPGRFITHFDVREMLEGVERIGRAVPEALTQAGLGVAGAAQRLPGGDRALEAMPAEGLATMRRFVDVVLRVQRSGAVYIAAINGPCGGGGFELVLSFDVRLAADDGVQLTLPELLIGLTSSVGGQRLAQFLGPARALEVLLEGRPLDPGAALQAGLVTEVLPAGELLDAARARAERYGRRGRATVAAQKRILFEEAVRPPAEALRREAAISLATTTSEPTRRALRAFVEAQERAGGESPFLVDIEPWAEGRVVEFGA